MKRQTISTKTKKQILDRFMNGCVRCWGLCSGDFGTWYGDYNNCIGNGHCHIHHIKEKVFGGGNEIENFIPLCICCHTELHSLGTVKLSTFLNSVPLLFRMKYQELKEGGDRKVAFAYEDDDGSKREFCREITDEEIEILGKGIVSYESFVKILVPFCTEEEKIWLLENRIKLLGF
jgi:hypothetical protein